MKLNKKLDWASIQGITSRSFVCGHCGNPVASEKGWTGKGPAGYASVHVCHHCTRPTYFDPDGEQVPGPASGNAVADISDSEVESLYEEARRAVQTNAFTAAILCCRKLLMHIAVAKGAKAGESFTTYVTYLSDQSFVPPDARAWVDHIRKKGNEANHEINIMAREDAEELLSFIEMLLRIIYEFPAKVLRRYPPSPDETGT